MQQDYKRQPVKLPNVYHNDYVKTRIRAREFENYLKLFEPSSNFEMYKDMRRSIKPSLPYYMYARHEINKFYAENGHYYPIHKKPIDWTILLKDEKSARSSASSSSRKSRSSIDVRNGSN